MAGTVRNAGDLLQRLGLPPDTAGDADAVLAAGGSFCCRVPVSFLARMRPGDAADPLLRQVLPVAEEVRKAAGFTTDPLGEARAAAAPGLLHKYHGRALLVLNRSCAVHCRYCFRRHFPSVNEMSWEAWLDLLGRDRSISEVILSGGDPLLLDDTRLAKLADALAGIPHLGRLRVHTRLPVMVPERVDDGLLGWLTGTRLEPIVVLHVNHGNEIDADVVEALERLRKAGVTLLNQSVLLRGVNDDEQTLACLSERLFSAGVLPYYLHMLDRVQGAAHFEVSEGEAVRLMAELRARLPGYLVPRLVREVAGAPCKVPVG